MTKHRKGTHQIGERLKQWRKAKGLSAYRLAKLTGVHPSFISNVEADRRPMPDEFMKKLAAVPELDLTYQTLRVWRMQADYDSQEILEAYANIKDLGPGLETGARLQRFPVKFSVNDGKLIKTYDDTQPSYSSWGDTEISNPEAYFCIKVKGVHNWTQVPDEGELLVCEVTHSELKDKRKYFIDSSFPECRFILVYYNEAQQHFVPLNSVIQPFSDKEKRVKRIYYVSYSRARWP